MRPSRGFTLVELMIGLVCLLAVAGVTVTLLTRHERVSHAQLNRAGLQDNLRTGALVVASELREVGFDSISLASALGSAPSVSTDLQVMEPDRIQYKAMRGAGFLCAPPTAESVRLRRVTLIGLRDPSPGDSLALFVEGDPLTSADDAWVHASVGTSTTATCADGASALALSVEFAGGVGATAPIRMTAGSPVRFFEVMEMRYYRADGKAWLGLRSVTAGGSIEPVVGPLADRAVRVRGLTFLYLDGAGAATPVASEVRAVQWTLRGVTDARVRGLGASLPSVDSLTLVSAITLRNSWR